MSLRYASSPWDDAVDSLEAHDERILDHQDGFCRAQHAAGKKAGEPWKVPPCGDCEPCRTIRKALDWREACRADHPSADADPSADAWALIAGLCERVEEERSRRVRLEQDLAWERQQVAALTRDRDAWKKEAWAAQEDAEAA